MHNWKKATLYIATATILSSSAITVMAKGHTKATKAKVTPTTTTQKKIHRENKVVLNNAAQATTTTTVTKTPPPFLTTPSARVKYFFTNTNFRNVITVSAGVSITQDAGHNNTFSDFGVTYFYLPYHANRPQGVYGFYFGREFDLSSTLFMQFGLGYHQAASYKARGTVQQDIIPYTYSYTFISRRAMIEGKLLETFKKVIHPYVSFGMGAGFTTSYDFVANNLVGTVSPVFAGSANTSFIYQVGAGIDVDVQNNIRLGVGYQFADLGRVYLGRGAIATIPIPQTLKQAHFYVNDISAQMSYIF